MAPTKLLLTGATGYIGGTVLTQLLDSASPEIKKLAISVLIRKKDQAAIYASKGVTPLIFNGLEATEDLRDIASGHDIIIHAADSTSPAAVEALILGLASSQEVSKPKYLLHVSGTSSLGDRPITKQIQEPTVFSDKEDIYSYLKEREAIDPYPQRATDIKTVEVGERAGINTLVVKAPLIYGRGTGLFNRKSFHIPALIQGAVAAGNAEHIGEGTGVWDYVHVVDLAGLFELLVVHILRGGGLSTGRTGIYFAETQRHSWKDLADAIAKAGYSLGRLTSPVSKSISLQEAADKYTGGDESLAEVGLASKYEPPIKLFVTRADAFFLSSLTSAQLGRELGWKPEVGIELQQAVLDDFTLLFGHS
ncbi:NAD(P)-binding protein [Aspergillus steynii IBT 23096]|uniref:NAD(P)-binding protein n=1 Tax=Aspergillus steynii IBT 23096 TaxID=1392250 RepID=A0A2I2G0D2_9EURO|nr:NAD(P)-binding protein [Aspergillus steynii IBT 23096]PLB46337.1 NAD(P)-binding protein [Aspergillus steynii IBT 23096]